MQNGQRWREQRNIISPTFTSGKMKQMLPLIKQAIERMTSFMDQRLTTTTDAATAADFDNKDLYSKLTLTVIARCAFATEINAFASEENIFVTNAKATFNFSLFKVFLDMVLPVPFKKWLELTIFPLKPLEFFMEMSKAIMSKRRALASQSAATQAGLSLSLSADLSRFRGLCLCA